MTEFLRSVSIAAPAIDFRALRMIVYTFEALREYRRARKSMDDLVQAAQEVRVANVIRPYLEAMTT